MKKRIIKFIVLAAVIYGCVETDFIADPPAQQQDGTITIQASGSSAFVNDMLQFSAKAYDASGSENQNVQFNWVTSNSAVLSINQGGTATANSVGQAWVVVSADGYKSDSAIVTVVLDTNQLAAISVNPISATLQVGDTVLFSAQGLNSMGNPIPNLNFTWQSNNQSVVSITSGGLATALASGTANISAVYNSIQSPNISVIVQGNSKSGMFTKNPGTNYNVSGSVEVVDNNGQLTVNIGSDFMCSSGPGLHVYISPTQTVGPGSIDLGDLISTSGAQSYAVPTGNNLDNFSYVIIHCVPFNVSFGYASIQ